MSDEAKWKRLWESDSVNRASIAEWRQYLKDAGLPSSGESRAISRRVTMHLDVKHLDLFVLQDGVQMTPYELKNPQLRKMVAQLGMDVMGDKDDLHFSLIEYLKKKKGSKGKDGEASGSGAPTAEPTGILMAKQILEMHDDYPAVLSASGINVSTDSALATMRKAYLKLSLLIHPDKLGKEFPEATKAFQALVTAYERLSQPELFLDEDDEPQAKKEKKIMRSNDGCHRTQIFCPRCKAEWGLPDSGVEKYDYNFMMLGLKTYNCAGCLFDFGCMSAVHKCPFCRGPFEYSPSDYHLKITCGKAKCTKPFGFFIFPISDRLEREYRLEIRKKLEAQLKVKEQLAERARRARGRAEDLGQTGKDKLLLLNLLDQCPRCGEELESNYEVRLEHLGGCKDPKNIAAYAKRLKAEEAEAEEKKRKRELQEDTEVQQSWDYLGGKISDIWMLTEKQVKGMCESYKLDSTGSKDEMITRLVRHRTTLDSSRMLTEGGGGEAAGPSSKKKKMTVEDLPANLESLTVAQLKSYCAAHGIVHKSGSKEGMIKEIEKRVHGEDEPFLRIEGKKKK